MAALREIAAHFGVSFDDKALKDGGSSIDGMVDKLKGFATTLGAGVALGAIYHFVTGMAEQADALQKQSDAMGLSLAEMQEWQYAAKMQNVDASTLTGVLTKLGSGKFDKGLAALGVSTKDASGELRSSTDILADVADGLQSIENPAERNRKAVAVLGKSYAKMLPLLQDGSKGIKELRDEFNELGGGFDEDFAKRSDEVGDNIDRLKQGWKSFAINIVSQILPPAVALSKWLVSTMKPVLAFVKHTKLLEAGMAGLAIKGVMLLSSKVGGLGGALKMLSGNFMAVLLPLLLIEDAFVFLSGGDSEIGRMIDRAFGKGTQDTVRKFFTDLDAQSKMSLDPKAGLGANLTGTGLLMASVFKQGMTDADNFYRVVDGVWRGIVLSASIAWEILRSGWASVGAFMQDALTAPGRAMRNSAVETGIENWKQQQREWLKKERNDPNSKYKGTADQTFDTPEQRAKDEAALAQRGKEMYEQQREKTASEQNDAYSAQRAAAHVAEYDRLATQLDPKTHTPEAVAESTMRATGVIGPPMPPNMTVTNTVTNVIPPGTPADQIKAVNAASAAGVDKGLKATQAALVPGGVK